MNPRKYRMLDDRDFVKAKERLYTGLSVLGRRSGAPQRIKDPAYAETLMELMRLVLIKDETVSLTAITEPEEFAALHLLDSLACVALPELESAKEVVDIGSGAGFPGLPLAALYPEKRFLLTDSLRKRTEFAAFAAMSLRLDNVDVIHTRAESAGRDPSLREHFDLALCRAVGKMPVIMEYTLPLVGVGGAACFYKTKTAVRELAESRLARELLGGGADVRILEYAELLPGRKHVLYLVKKERPTPKTYPRREGIPSKVPL